MAPSEPGSENAGAGSPTCGPADGACAIATAPVNTPDTIIVAIIIRMVITLECSVVPASLSPIA
jgi:hypothetical protein